MAESQLLRKDQLETSLFNERKLISAGKLKEDNPLDLSEPFRELCEACRRGNLRACQEKITEGVNINGRDLFDCTPLILVSESPPFASHYTNLCLYNALNPRIRNLLLEYDYSKSTDPLQPFAAHITSLLSREHPQTTDIEVTAAGETFRLHKFILSARSPYFHKKLTAAPEATAWRLPLTIPPPAFSAGIRYLYFGEAPKDLRSGPGAGGFTESEIFEGIDRIAKHLELRSLVDTILESGDRRLARQRRSDEVSKGRNQLEAWFQENIAKHKMVVDTDKANEVKWARGNAIFADVLLRADEDHIEEENPQEAENGQISNHGDVQGEIPIGAFSRLSVSSHKRQPKRKSVIFPAHRAMLLRSEFFLVMFSSSFREAQVTDNLQVVSIDCTPEVLEIVLRFLYTEKADFPLEIAVDVLFAADLLLIEKLKTKAAVLISTLGSGNMASLAKSPGNRTPGTSNQHIPTSEGEGLGDDGDLIDIYEIIRAGWLMRIQRLEEFAARYLAYRLEEHIDSPEFEQLVIESAERIEVRQETDSIELIDDIRYYLSERFRLRFEDSGIDMLDSERNPDKIDPVEEKPKAPSTAIPSSISPGTAINGNLPSPTPLKTPPSSNGQLGEVDLVQRREQHKGANLGAPNGQENGENGQANGSGVIRTLDGQVAGDEFSRDAINYEHLLNKLDQLLEKLGLDG
ncbi:hypothetical protein FQN49_005272 [Arthroderma sp. PD_2]|nr:hypothetical protein FQN49_005272 [Arthroderma sp. PD_2]